MRMAECGVWGIFFLHRMDAVAKLTKNE